MRDLEIVVSAKSCPSIFVLLKPGLQIQLIDEKHLKHRKQKYNRFPQGCERGSTSYNNDNNDNICETGFCKCFILRFTEANYSHCSECATPRHSVQNMYCIIQYLVYCRLEITQSTVTLPSFMGSEFAVTLFCRCLISSS